MVISNNGEVKLQVFSKWSYNYFLNVIDNFWKKPKTLISTRWHKFYNQSGIFVSTFSWGTNFCARMGCISMLIIYQKMVQKVFPH